MATLAIIGLGLIGGSLGLALKRAAPADTVVVGFDRDPQVAERARRAGAVQQVARSLTEAVEKAGLVVVATPVVNVRGVFEEMAPALQRGTIVTDTASTKADVLRWAQALLPAGVHFVGGHPMAGKETPGPQAAEESLFEGRPYCIVPSVAASSAAVSTVVGLVLLVGGRLVYIDAEEHDALAAGISHLPLAASLALFNLTQGSASWPEMANLAGPAFRDLTRLASGSPEMAHDIFLTNRDNVLHWIERYVTELQRLADLIGSSDSEELFRVLAQTQIERDNFLASLPQHPEPVTSDVDIPSGGDSFMTALTGSFWSQRSNEVLKLMEERSREQELEDRLHRRP